MQMLLTIMPNIFSRAGDGYYREVRLEIYDIDKILFRYQLFIVYNLVHKYHYY